MEINVKPYQGKLSLIPMPAYFFNVGDSVSVGALDNAKIVESIHDGRIYLVSHIETNKAGGAKIINHVLDYWSWLDIRPKAKSIEHEFVRNTDLQIQYHQVELRSLLFRRYDSGIDFDVDYQRPLVWDLKDKISLIDSIFNNVNIGTFILKEKHFDETSDFSYECVDGKQRFNAICEFYENRFAYNGKFYNDLSFYDRNFFKTKLMSYGELSQSSTREQILRTFLLINTTGKVMESFHLQKVKNMLELGE